MLGTIVFLLVILFVLAVIDAILKSLPSSPLVDFLLLPFLALGEIKNYWLKVAVSLVLVSVLPTLWLLNIFSPDNLALEIFSSLYILSLVLFPLLQAITWLPFEKRNEKIAGVIFSMLNGGWIGFFFDKTMTVLHYGTWTYGSVVGLAVFSLIIFLIFVKNK